MNNNGFNNNYPTGGYYSGMMYQGQPQKLKMTQGLTPEEMKSLRKTGGFSLDIGQDELWQAFCTHRYEDRFAIAEDEEGNAVCAICGTKFPPFNGTAADANNLINQVVGLLETVKMKSLTLPQKTIQDVFQIEPILKRIPSLLAQTNSEYNRFFGGGDNYVYGQENNAFAMYQNMLNPMAGNGYFDPAMNMQYNNQQPMYGQPQAQMYPGQPPMYNQQPVYNNNYQPYTNQQPQAQMYPGQPPMYNQPDQGNPFNSNQGAINNPVQNNTNKDGNNGSNTVTVSKQMTD